MASIKRILFLMCDQLRWDYLSCSGHPHLKTPNIDKLAARGVRFDRAYVQSPICGPSRMCFYTGRHMTSHGSHWNNFPLNAGEWTLGDYIRPLGTDAVLVGKTHMRADEAGMARLGLDKTSLIGARTSECGFDVVERDDGIHPEAPGKDASGVAYNRYLAEKGYDPQNGWSRNANSVEDGAGQAHLGWFFRYLDGPARIDEPDSETPYMFRRAMEYIAGAGDSSWLLHLSVIKPHWPYVAPAPYNAMYGPEHFPPVVRSEAEREDPHPVYQAFMERKVSQIFDHEGAREKVIPAYMGLIRQIDDQIGILLADLESKGLMEETMIVFTSDHGDYLGDHWMGEKDLFHDCSARIPLIICDPRPEADASRGTVCDALVQAIDLVPTFVEALGGEPAYERLEGLSLMPWIRGETPDPWRDYVVSEYDYSVGQIRQKLGQPTNGCLMVMIADKRWKWIKCKGFERTMLYDLEADPDELVDLGARPGYEDVHRMMNARLLDWSWRPSQRVTVSDQAIERRNPGDTRKTGSYKGYWDEAEAGLETGP